MTGASAAPIAEPAPQRLSLLDVSIIAAVNLMWGLNLIAMKAVVALAQPFTAGGLRMFLVLALCLPWLRIAPGRMGPLLTFAAITGGLHLIILNTALALSANVSALAIVTLLGVPFALVLAAVFLAETIPLARILGVSVSLGGCALLLFDPRVTQERAGLAAMVLATVVWAVAMLIQRRLAGIPIRTVFAWVGLVGAILLLPLGAVIEGDPIAAVRRLTPGGWAWLAFAAAGPMLLGQGGMTWLLQRHPVSKVMPLVLAAPAVTVVASSLIYHTPLTPLMVVGGLVALSGATALTLSSAGQARQVR